MADIAKLIYKGNIFQAGGAGSIVPSVEPSNPEVGQLWYDIENSVIYIWDGEAWEVIGGTKPVEKYKTFTISWTENNDPTTVANSVVYSDDAAGLVAGSKEFDEFFGYYGCRLASNGKRYNWGGTEITDDSEYNYTTLMNMPTSGLNSGNDVMVCFPRRGIKMTKTGSVITLSITSNPDYFAAIDEGYQYYAFTKGTWANHDAKTNIQDRMLIGVYEGYVSSNNLYSYSGVAPSSGNSSYSTANFKTYSDNRGDSYSYMRWYNREYVNCLYMMKYGNPNSQATIGNGIVSGSKHNTGEANSLTNDGITPSGGNTSNDTTACRLFGLENWWGNLSEWCAGIHTASGNSNVATALWKNSNDASTTVDGTYYQQQSVGSAIGTNGRPATAMAGNNKGMFIPTAVYSNQTWTVGYCDWSLVNAGYIAHVSGNYGGGLGAGAFFLDVASSPSYSNAGVGSRLVYL